MTCLFFTILGYVTTSLSLQDNNFAHLFVNLGKSSLGIYGFQQILIGVIIESVDKFEISIPPPYVTVIITSIFVLFLSYYFTKLCSCYNFLSIPFLGRRVMNT